MTTPREGQERGPRVAGGRGVLLLSLAAVLLNGWFFRFLPVDDSFISYRYAVNFARGHGLVYNIGERVEGYTNFLWVLILGVGAKLHADPVRLGAILGGIASLLAVLMTWRLGQRMLTEEGRTDRENGLIASVPALFLAVSPALGIYGFCGLETPLFTLLIVTAAFLAMGRCTGARDELVLALVLFLATLTRPEGLLVFGILLVAAPGPGAGRDRLRRALRRSAAYAAPLAVYLTWKVAYFGAIVPNTAHAKLEPGLRSMAVGLSYVLESYLEHGLLACGLLFVLCVVRAFRAPALRPILILVIVYSLYVVAVGGDFFPFGRFILPVLPFYYIALADGMGEALAKLRQRPGSLSAFALRPGAPGWAAVFAAAIASAGWAWRDHIVSPESDAVARYVVAGRWLAENASPDEVIASGAAGAIAYYSDLRCIDMLGLTDPTVARSGQADPGAFTPGHTKADPAYVFSRRPDYVFVPNVYYDERPLTMRTAQTFGAMRGEAELMSMAAFRAEYRIENVRIDGKYLGFWRRVRGPQTAEVTRGSHPGP